MRKTVLVFGGDRRQYIAAEILHDRGYDIAVCGFEKMAHQSNLKSVEAESLPYADFCLLPAPYKDTDGAIKMPFSDRRVKLYQVSAQLNPNAAVVFGGADEESKNIFSDLNLSSFDILADETYTIRNAFITSQAAVMLACSRSLRALSDCSVLICGYGRIGKTLSDILKGFRASITVTARKEKDLEWIRTEGAKAVNTADIHTVIGENDIIFNTIPSRVIYKRELEMAKKDAIFIELASKPHGIDFEEAKRLGLETYIELGLPGRFFPYSAAIAVADAFQRIAIKRMVGERDIERG
jgi:dipicolinate synthase subunit A